MNIIHFSNNPHDIYSLIQEDSDNNWILELWAGLLLIQQSIINDKNSSWKNIGTNRQQFKNFIVGHFSQYGKKIRDSYYWEKIKVFLHFLNYIKLI